MPKQIQGYEAEDGTFFGSYEDALKHDIEQILGSECDFAADRLVDYFKSVRFPYGYVDTTGAGQAVYTSPLAVGERVEGDGHVPIDQMRFPDADDEPGMRVRPVVPHA